MMTDYKKLTALLDDFGIGYDCEDCFEPDLRPKVLHCMFVTCSVGDDKTEGYIGFFTKFEFAPSGEFVEMSVWE